MRRKLNCRKKLFVEKQAAGTVRGKIVAVWKKNLTCQLYLEWNKPHLTCESSMGIWGSSGADSEFYGRARERV